MHFMEAFGATEVVRATEGLGATATEATSLSGFLEPLLIFEPL